MLHFKGQAVPCGIERNHQHLKEATQTNALELSSPTSNINPAHFAEPELHVQGLNNRLVGVL